MARTVKKSGLGKGLGNLIPMEEEKEKRIRQEKDKLKRQFNKIDKKKKSLAARLIENAAFMAITLEELQQEINEKGCISEYKNGENQYGTKKPPEVEVYNTMVKNYAAVIRQLTDLLPEGSEKPNDGFDDFISRR